MTIRKLKRKFPKKEIEERIRKDAQAMGPSTDSE